MPKDTKLHDALCTQLGKEQYCPECGGNNPSGKKLPDECIWCGVHKNSEGGTMKTRIVIDGTIFWVDDEVAQEIARLDSVIMRNQQATESVKALEHVQKGIKQMSREHLEDLVEYIYRQNRTHINVALQEWSRADPIAWIKGFDYSRARLIDMAEDYELLRNHLPERNNVSSTTELEKEEK